MKKYENVKWKPFQEEILKIAQSEGHDRLIHWFWSKDGDLGKSFVAKYLACTMKGVILCGGKETDIHNQVCHMMDTEEDGGENTIPKLALLNIAKANKKKVCYTLFEDLKDGFLYSGKYKGGQCIFPAIPVIVTANFPADVDSMTNNRFFVKEIEPI